MTKKEKPHREIKAKENQRIQDTNALTNHNRNCDQSQRLTVPLLV